MSFPTVHEREVVRQRHEIARLQCELAEARFVIRKQKGAILVQVGQINAERERAEKAKTVLASREKAIEQAARQIADDAFKIADLTQERDSDKQTIYVLKLDCDDIGRERNSAVAERDSLAAEAKALRERLKWIACASRDEIEEMLRDSACDDVDDMIHFIDEKRAALASSTTAGETA